MSMTSIGNNPLHIMDCFEDISAPASYAKRVSQGNPLMAPPLEQAGAGGSFPSFLAISLVGLTASLLALCTLCRRKEKRRRIPQDGVMLEEAAGLLTVARPHQLNSTNSKAKDQRSAGASIPCEDDGTISSCSFIILPQRGLPQIPPEDLLSPDQTYSNLSFPNQAEDALYEPMPVMGDAVEEWSRVTEEEKGEDAGGAGQEDKGMGAEYACVLKGKKMKTQHHARIEAGTPQAAQQGSLPGTPHTAQALPVEDMYSVVRKERKEKAKKVEGSHGHSGERTSQEEMSLSNALVAAVLQEPDGSARHQSSLFQSPAIEPCYESVVCESWVGSGRKPSTEPAYETVDAYWKSSKRKRKPNRSAPAENLYESIENLAFQNQNMLAHFEI